MEFMHFLSDSDMQETDARYSGIVLQIFENDWLRSHKFQSVSRWGSGHPRRLRIF